MKTIKILAGILLILCSSFLFGQQKWISFNGETPQPPQITVLEQNTSRVVLEIEVPGMMVYDVEDNNVLYQRLELNRWRTTKDIGKGSG